MNNLFLIIPFIFSLLLLILFNKKVKWWEYTVLIASGIVVNIIVTAIMKDYNCNDKQYLGDYVKEVRYYETWDEWIHKTCHRTHRDSKGHTYTTTYDCSYKLVHPASWVMITSQKRTFDISKDDYNRIIKLWKSPNKWVDMHRHFYKNDGDMYTSSWDKDKKTIIPITVIDDYTNKIQGSKSVFKFEDISSNDAKELGLFDYPNIEYQQMPLPQDVYKKTYQKSVLGLNDKNFIASMDYINAVYGPSKHIRTYILVFTNKAHSIAFKQRSYWNGGNFNELIVCIGINSNNKNIDWCETFSWENNPELSVKTKQWFIANNNVDSLKNFPIWYESKLKANIWKCKNADDFNYLKTELTNTQLIWLLIISLIICIGVSLWALLNKYDN